MSRRNSIIPKSCCGNPRDCDREFCTLREQFELDTGKYGQITAKGFFNDTIASNNVTIFTPEDFYHFPADDTTSWS